MSEGMGVESADKRFSASLHLVSQVRAEYRDADAGREAGFRAWAVRPAVRGRAGLEWLSYFVQWELAGANPGLLDAELTVQPWSELGLRVGQFITPFTREFLVPIGALSLPDFAPSNIVFRNNRDVGAMLMGSLFRSRFEYYLAAVNGGGANRANDNAQVEVVGRAVANLAGKTPMTESPQLDDSSFGASIGFNASRDEVERASDDGKRQGASVSTTKLGADVTAHYGPFAFQAEGYARRTSPATDSTALGGYARVGAFALPRTLEFVLRGDLVDLDGRGVKSANPRIDAGLNLYAAGQHAKLQLRYAWTDVKTPVSPQDLRGVSHWVTVQAQIWF